MMSRPDHETFVDRQTEGRRATGHRADRPPATGHRPPSTVTPGTAIVVMFALLAASPVWAHDFWIEPSTFRPAVGQLFTTSLLVGQDFAGDPIPRSTQLMDTFTVREGASERPVVGMENRDPAGYVRIEKPGIAVIGYRSKPYPLELAADKFEEFLKLEGLDNIKPIRH